MRGSVVTVFLMNSRQNFRERENTTREDIQRWAEELGVEVAPPVSLAGAQFRCGGSVEYLDWVESVLRGSPPGQCARLAAQWRRQDVAGSGAQAQGPRKAMQFTVCATPAELECRLRQKVEAGATARLLASYAREWKTDGMSNPHHLPPPDMDFYIPYREDAEAHYWSRIWNYRHPVFGYTAFVQAPDGSPMGDDPLCEVGCPYVVRGFDYDYVGILWLDDIRWQPDGWIVDPKHVFESGLLRATGRARKERGHGREHGALRDKLLQGYRILLTRAIKGVYVWFENDATRQRIEACLGA